MTDTAAVTMWALCCCWIKNWKIGIPNLSPDQARDVRDPRAAAACSGSTEVTPKFCFIMLLNLESASKQMLLIKVDTPIIKDHSLTTSYLRNLLYICM